MDSITFTREELKDFSQVVEKISEFLHTKPEEKPWPQPEDIVWVSNPQDPDSTFHILYKFCSEHMKTQGRIFKTRDEAMQHAIKWHYRMMYDRCAREAWAKCQEENSPWVWFAENHPDKENKLEFWQMGKKDVWDGRTVFPTNKSCKDAINLIGTDKFLKYVLGVK